jgi:anti-sigma B factor antagonist
MSGVLGLGRNAGREAGPRFRGTRRAAADEGRNRRAGRWRRAAMQIEERVVDGVTILDLKGKMTLGEGDELLKDKINSLIQQDRKKLLLNLEGVPYIDSAGLGEIVRTYTTVSRQGGKLKLLNLTKRIQDLLAITKLLTVFETYESEPDAVKSFAG